MTNLLFVACLMLLTLEGRREAFDLLRRNSVMGLSSKSSALAAFWAKH